MPPPASDAHRRRPRGGGARAWTIPALAASLLAALGACAQSPESIAAAPVEEARYGHLTCPELGAELGRLHRGLANLSNEQGAKRVNDAVGWTRLLHPAHSARTRDIRSWIAVHKGELDAVERAMGRRCPGSPVLS